MNVHVKVVNMLGKPRFVTCYPMAELGAATPKTFPQWIPQKRAPRYHEIESADHGIGAQARTHIDNE